MSDENFINNASRQEKSSEQLDRFVNRLQKLNKNFNSYSAVDYAFDLHCILEKISSKDGKIIDEIFSETLGEALDETKNTRMQNALLLRASVLNSFQNLACLANKIGAQKD